MLNNSREGPPTSALVGALRGFAATAAPHIVRPLYEQRNSYRENHLENEDYRASLDADMENSKGSASNCFPYLNCEM